MTPKTATITSLLTCLLPLLLTLLTEAAAAAQTETLTETLPNFIAQDDLNDGQHEVRIHYNGVSAKQTSVRRDQGSSSGLVLRQVHHRHRLLTLVYVGEAAEDLSVDGLSLRDCRVSGDDGEVAEFLEKFVEDAAVARTSAGGSWSGSLNNVTFGHLDEEDQLPQYLRPVLHFRKLRVQCRDHKRDVRKAVRAQRRLERPTKRHHHHHHHHHQGDANTDSLPATTTTAADSQPQSSSLSRRRRWILKEFFILPGTKWCGNDDLATSYGDLDGHLGADKCCRQHDKCPLNIGGMASKYGTFNRHPTTVSHCICDERFKACLKMTGTAAADLVGDVFFNKMKTKCFSLERKKVCTKWASWFGPCTKYSIKQVAVLRDNLPYKF